MPADGVEPGRGDGFAFALILISSDQLKTVPVGIADLYNAMVIDWSMIMPAGMLVIVPGVTVFVCVQRYLVAGWGAGAVKGRTFARRRRPEPPSSRPVVAAGTSGLPRKEIVP